MTTDSATTPDSTPDDTTPDTDAAAGLRVVKGDIGHAGKRRAKRKRPAARRKTAAPVEVVKISDAVMAAAMILARKDNRRIQLNRDGSVTVWNPPHALTKPRK